MKQCYRGQQQLPCPPFNVSTAKEIRKAHYCNLCMIDPSWPNKVIDKTVIIHRKLDLSKGKGMSYAGKGGEPLR